MKLRVIGCHGGETPKHRTSAFLLDNTFAIDAGSLTSEMDLKEQLALEAVVVSHSHMDHIRDLATIADNRVQVGARPLIVAGTRPTIDALRKHFFNGVLWPDFSRLPSAKKPTIHYQELESGKASTVAGYTVTPIPVTHTIDCSGFLIQKGKDAVAYSGDTGPTDRFWDVLSGTKNLRAALVEVSVPNEHQHFASLSGHHTPQTLIRDLKKLRNHKDLPILLYHVKPNFQRQTERECAKLKGFDITMLALGDRFIL